MAVDRDARSAEVTGAGEPRLAAQRVSVIGSIGYCGFLAGPPLIGFFGDQESLRRALISVAVLLAIAGLLASALRPPSKETSWTSS